MTTSTMTLAKAREALERLQNWANWADGGVVQKAINALRWALAEPEKES